MDSAGNLQSPVRDLSTARLASCKPEARVKRAHSKATNGRRSFAVGGDGNSPWHRRWKDLNNLHASDLGGKDYISEAQKSLIRRASTLEIELEQMEAAMSEGVAVDPELYGRIASHLRRILESLGLGRVARDVNELDLSSYASRAYRLAAEPAGIDTPPPGEGPAPPYESPVTRAPVALDADLLPHGTDAPLRAAGPQDRAAGPPGAASPVYRPSEPQPEPHRAIEDRWPPAPEAPRRDTNLPSNTPPPEPEAPRNTPPEPPSNGDVIPANRPKASP